MRSCGPGDGSLGQNVFVAYKFTIGDNCMFSISIMHLEGAHTFFFYYINPRNHLLNCPKDGNTHKDNSIND